MKIFKPINESKTEVTKDLADELLNNRLSVKDKYMNLIRSYENIGGNPGTDLRLIEQLIGKFGGNIRYPRVGDNNERFDAFIEFNECYCVVEIEIPSIAILDAPRNLLDDYAVAYSRNQIKEKPIVPLVICWDLPNKRSDYWNVINDINKIVNLKIKTISIPALALHYWSNKSLDLVNDYYLDCDHQIMRAAYEMMEDHMIPKENALGYLEPMK